jgi:hypothetical protein
MPLLEHLELCWFLLDQRLVLSTSTAQSREIIRAARGKATSLGASPALAAHLPTDVGPAPLNEWVFMRGAALSKVLSDWIAYLEKNRPEMLSPTWWQNWAAGRIEHYTRLGLVLVPDKTSPVRAVVQQIDADSPARNVLQTGDIVLAAAGRALTTTRPAREVAQRYRDRGQSRRFHVRVLRAGRIMDLQVPVQPASPIDLHDFDPILALRQVAALTRHVDTVTLRRQSAKPDRMDAHLIIRWESSP